MSEDQFTKLFKYIEEFRADVNKRFDDASTDRADIKGAIAELECPGKGLSQRDEIYVTSD